MKAVVSTRSSELATRATARSTAAAPHHQPPGFSLARIPILHPQRAIDVVSRGTDRLPYLGQLQRAFGHHDLSTVRTRTDERARDANGRLAATAYTYGERIAFAERPSLRLAAHEAAHVVQQRSGIRPSMAHERHADAVADAVVGGRSAEALLGDVPSRTDVAAPCVQGQTASPEAMAALSRPDPTAGPVDLGGVLGALQNVQSMADLLATLDQIDQANELDELWQYTQAYAPSDQRLATAFLVRIAIGRRNGQNVPPDALAKIAAAIPNLWLRQDGADIVAYAAALKGGNEREAEGLVSQLSTSPDYSSDAVLAAAPGVVLQGPWNPPGKQWPGFYIGNSAHQAIADYYQLKHPTDRVMANYFTMSTILNSLGPSGTAWAPEGIQNPSDLGLEPDIVNLTLLHLYEIKPEAEMSEAVGKAATYAAIFNAASVSMELGPSNDPGVIGVLPAPAGYYRFWSPVPGVILYQYKKGDYYPVPEYQPQEQEDTSDVKEKAGNAAKSAAIVTALYWIVSEGSRVFLPRNAIPIP